MLEFKVPAGSLAARVVTTAFKAWAPPPKLTISEWADKNRMLSPESAAEPGRWVTSRAEYQRGIMDAISDTTFEAVVIMTSAQVGKTEIINNVVGYFIDQDPSPILDIQPTLDMAKTWSKDRLAPMLRDTPCLQGRVQEARSRDSGNVILHKLFPGGHISIAGANSAAGLASRPIRVLLGDEVDRYPPSAGTEGDPVRLARKRTTAFWNRRIVLASTPTLKGFSRIEAEWEFSDQRHYFVPCQHCGEMQHLQWKNVQWPAGEPDKAALHCESCGVEWSEPDRLVAVRHGEWRATAPGNGTTAGFHLNELYSPWSTPAKMAQDFIECQGDPVKLQTWVNTSLGESWEPDAERADPQTILGRLEDWGASLPAEVLVLTAGVDVQDDRLEIERVGWGIGEESWSIEHRIIYGDPSASELWTELDEYLSEPSPRVDSRQLYIQAVCVDSGGHYTQEVYKFSKARQRRRVWAIKGVGGQGRTVWPKRASKVQKGNANVYIVGVDAAKDVIYARLKMLTRAAGFCHFPTRDPDGEPRDRTYFEQLTAEVVVTKHSKGFPIRVYELPAGRRNEALDCRVYAYAALQSLNVRWGAAMAASAKDKATTPPPTAKPKVEGIAAPRPQVETGRRPEILVRESPARGGGLPRRKGWLSR